MRRVRVDAGTPTSLIVNQPVGNQNLRGIVAMLCAVACFAVMDACLKILSAHYPPIQVAALRGMAGLPLVLGWAWWRGAFGEMMRVRFSLHLLRGALAIVMLLAFSYGLRTLPLSEAYAIFFVAPLLITALAVPILGEHVDWRRWVAIGVGMAGVLIVMRPTTRGLLSLGGLAIMASAAGYAASAISVRVLGRSDSTFSMVFWMVVLLSIGAGLLAWPTWMAVRAQDAWVLVGIAVFGTAGQVCVTEAFRRGEASVIAPFEYTALAWGSLLDWLLWHVLPESMTLIGAAVIVASGIYLIRREHARARHAPE